MLQTVQVDLLFESKRSDLDAVGTRRPPAREQHRRLPSFNSHPLFIGEARSGRMQGARRAADAADGARTPSARSVWMASAALSPSPVPHRRNLIYSSSEHIPGWLNVTGGSESGRCSGGEGGGGHGQRVLMCWSQMPRFNRQWKQDGLKSSRKSG